MVHSRQVADRCLLIAKKHPELKLDVEFLEEAAMLHDIGIYRCNAPARLHWPDCPAAKCGNSSVRQQAD